MSETWPRSLRRTAFWWYVLFQVPFGPEEGSGLNQHLASQFSLYVCSFPCWIHWMMWKQKFGKFLCIFWIKIIVRKKLFSSKPAVSCINGIFFFFFFSMVWTIRLQIREDSLKLFPWCHLCIWLTLFWDSVSGSVGKGFSCLCESTLWNLSPPDHFSAGTAYVVQYPGYIFIIPAQRTSTESIYHPYKCVTGYELQRGERSGLCGPAFGVMEPNFPSMNQQQLHQLWQDG